MKHLEKNTWVFTVGWRAIASRLEAIASRSMSSQLPSMELPGAVPPPEAPLVADGEAVDTRPTSKLLAHSARLSLMFECPWSLGGFNDDLNVLG